MQTSTHKTHLLLTTHDITYTHLTYIFTVPLPIAVELTKKMYHTTQQDLWVLRRQVMQNNQTYAQGNIQGMLIVCFLSCCDKKRGYILKKCAKN